MSKKINFNIIEKTRSNLLRELDTLEVKKDILKSKELKALFDQIRIVEDDKRAEFGKEVNKLRNDLIKLASSKKNTDVLEQIDVTAPADKNISKKDFPKLLGAEQGSINPLNKEIDTLIEIFRGLGFSNIDSTEIDDDYHMFGALNFPEGHPARDDYDTFLLNEKDSKGRPLVAPAHTSTMQNRILKEHKKDLENGADIAYIIPGRVYRNEDVDSRHEHTFYQFEGIYVGRNVSVANLLNILKTMFSKYFNYEVEIKVQPFYFPFTEPSFELTISCPFCDKKGCKVCSRSGWIELLGCGMIHPNVLKEAGIDPEIFTGFAWGCGINRLAMIKYGIEEIRNFLNGNLDFMEQF